MSDILILECPNCGEFFETSISTINCAIYRHGVIKNNMEQMNPHAPKNVCDTLKQTDKIYGCGKPFQVVKENESYKAVKCDYI